MKLVFFTRELSHGGAQRQLLVLARALQERGHEILVVVLYSRYDLEPDLARTGIPVVSLGKTGRWDIPRTLWRLVTLVRREQPDALHSYLGTPNALSVLVKPFFRGKVIWGIRGSERDLRGHYPWVARAVDAAQRRLGRYADLIVFNSHDGMETLTAAGLPRERAIVISNGIDIERFQRDARERERVRAELNIEPADRLVGLLARLDPMKDHETFLEAAAILSRKRSDVRFVCVGSGEGAYADSMRAVANRLGLRERVMWAGARNDMPAVHSAIDTLVLSSRFGEGFPNVVGEAMACGVPCVVTEVGDAARVVGDLGTAVPARDARGLAEAITLTLDRLERGEIDRAALRERIVECFSVDVLAQRTESALVSVLDEHTRAVSMG